MKRKIAPKVCKQNNSVKESQIKNQIRKSDSVKKIRASRQSVM